MSDFFDIKKLQENSARVRANATDAQLALMDEVDRAVEAEVQLRAWAKQLCGYSLKVSEIEKLRSTIAETKSGKVFTFKPNGHNPIFFIKTVFGHVDQVERYVHVLEKTVIDVTSNSQFTALSNWGLIKLGLRRLGKSLVKKVLNRS